MGWKGIENTCSWWIFSLISNRVLGEEVLPSSALKYRAISFSGEKMVK